MTNKSKLERLTGKDVDRPALDWKEHWQLIEDIIKFLKKSSCNSLPIEKLRRIKAIIEETDNG